MLHSHRNGKKEQGQILVLFELVFVLIVVAAALVIDIGLLRNNKQTMVNTMNAAALAGGSELPITGSAATTTTDTLINASVAANYPGLPASSTAIGSRCVTGVDGSISQCAYTITYKCLIGVDSGGNPYVSRDVPAVCNPTYAVGHTPVVSDFSGAGPTRIAPCRPDLGDKCNVVLVAGAETTQYALAPLAGINSGSTGLVSAAACNGPCGAAPTIPVDLVVIIDRTASMSDTDVANTQLATDAILKVYNPAVQRIAFGLIGPSSTSTACSGSPTGVYGKALTSSSGYGTTLPVGGNAGNLKNWIPVGLTGNTVPVTGDPIGFNEAYVTGSPATLNASSHIVVAIGCFDSPGGTGTDLSAPIRMARAYLDLYGRTGVKWGIILETDGQPNSSSGLTPASDFTCLQANSDATAAKADAKAPGGGIEIFTVGFGLDGGNDATCPDSSGAFAGKTATYLLASMATQPSSDQYGCPGTGTVNSNNDGDNFFCVVKSSDTTTLSPVFSTVATTFAGTGPRLIQIYPAPVVLSAGGATTSVTISGEYFTGATSVTFGAGAGTIISVSDSTIMAKAPTGTSGASVAVVVTTPGGSSVPTSASQYKYP